MITAQEIKDLVFQKNTDLAIIRQNIIDLVVAENNIIPSSVVLGDHPQLQTLYKSFLAYMVKAYLIEQNQNKTGTKGTMKAQGSNEQSADEQKAKRIASSFATKYKRQVVSYLLTNQLIEPEVDENIINKILIL